MKEVIKINNKDIIMIFPKSIIGFMPENFNDANATIVVKAV